MKKLLIASSICLSLLVITTGCQAQSVSGVYSGVELSISPLMGGGMNRDDITLYLRPNNTFTRQVEKPDWKTAVDGNWAISGNEVVLTYSDGKTKPRRFDIVKPDRLRTGGGYILYKMDIANSIPKGVYEFKHASGSGGMGANLPYVGLSGSQFIYFDGNGNFSQETEKLVSVTGDNIGGGTNSNKSASGTYSIKDGMLTMNFGDGHKTTHSIFINKDKTKETMAFIDGDAFFLQTEKELAEKLGDAKGSNTASRTRSTGTNNKTETNTGGSATNVSASSMVTKMRTKHGGTAIDGLKTITVTASLQGLDLKAVTDYDREWTRLETKRNGQLVMVEQLEGNSGWQWSKGKKTTLSAQRVKELKTGFSAGLAGLRQSKLVQLNKGNVKKEKTGYSLTYTADGIQMGILTNDDFEVTGEVKQTQTGFAGIMYEDLRDVNGILIPFTEKHTNGKTNMTIKISKIEINKAGDADFTASL